MDNETPELQPPAPQAPLVDNGSILAGCGLGCLIQIAFLAIGALVAFATPGRLSDISFFSVGVTQWLGIIPTIMVERSKNKSKTVTGLIITGCIGFLLSSACAAMVLNMGPMHQTVRANCQRHIMSRAQSTLKRINRNSAKMDGSGFCRLSPVSSFQKRSVPKKTTQKITIAIGSSQVTCGVPNHMAGNINPRPGRKMTPAPSAPRPSKPGSRKFIARNYIRRDTLRIWR